MIYIIFDSSVAISSLILNFLASVICYVDLSEGYHSFTHINHILCTFNSKSVIFPMLLCIVHGKCCIGYIINLWIK